MVRWIWGVGNLEAMVGGFVGQDLFLLLIVDTTATVWMPGGMGHIY